MRRVMDANSQHHRVTGYIRADLAVTLIKGSTRRTYIIRDYRIYLIDSPTFDKLLVGRNLLKALGILPELLFLLRVRKMRRFRTSLANESEPMKLASFCQPSP